MWVSSMKKRPGLNSTNSKHLTTFIKRNQLYLVMGTVTQFAGMGIFGMPLFKFFEHRQLGHCLFQKFLGMGRSFHQ